MRLEDAHYDVAKARRLTVRETMTAGRALGKPGAAPGKDMLNEALGVGVGAGYAGGPDRVGGIVAWIRGEDLVAAMGERARDLVIHHAADRVVDVAAHEVCKRVRVALAA